MQLRVTQYGEPILRNKGTKILVFDQELAKLSENMLETMYEAEGIGLAAQQIGLDLQIFVIDLQLPDAAIDFECTYDGKHLPLSLIMPLVVINPEITPVGSDSMAEEGCLSFGSIRGLVKRQESVILRFQDLEGNFHTIECGGIFARCIQHEYDHLQGILFIDRMERPTLHALEAKLKKLKRAARNYLKQQF